MRRLLARLRVVQSGTWVVVGVFAVVRATYFFTGGGMATSLLQTSWQLLDLKQLRHDPFGSVWLLHIQPPLFNLFVGGVERWGPIDPGGVYKVLYLLCGLVLVVSLRALLLELGWSSLASTIGAAVVAASPVLLSYENTITYELPVATAIVVAGLWCVRYVRTRRTKPLVILAAALTFATMTRALMHPLWLVGVLAFVLIVAHPERGWRAVVAGFAIPLVFAGGWMLKNEILFGEPNLSSWLGDNLARGVIAPMPKHEIKRLVRDDTLTHAALVRGFAVVRPVPAADPEVPHRLDRAGGAQAGEAQRIEQLQRGLLPARVPPGAGELAHRVARAARRLPRHALRPRVGALHAGDRARRGAVRRQLDVRLPRHGVVAVPAAHEREDPRPGLDHAADRERCRSPPRTRRSDSSPRRSS